MDVEKGRLEKLKEVDNVHLITGLVKMFFKWEFVFLIILDQKPFSRDLKEPIISEDLLKKLSAFVQVNKVHSENYSGAQCPYKLQCSFKSLDVRQLSLALNHI